METSEIFNNASELVTKTVINEKQVAGKAPENLNKM